MSQMKKRAFNNAVFCPFCGTETLDRDDYRREHGKCSANGRSSYEYESPEYICRLCGIGFKLSASLRHEHARTLFAEHRKMRPPIYNELGEKV